MPESSAEAVLAHLERKSGRSLDDWIALVEREGPPGLRDRVIWLTTVQKLTQVTAVILARECLKRSGAYEAPGDDDD